MSTKEAAPNPTEKIQNSSRVWTLDRNLVTDIDFGVPDPEVIDQVAGDIIQLLERQGIDPGTVVFSGYKEGSEEKDELFDTAAQLKEELQRLSTEANQKFANGEFDSDPVLRDDYSSRIQALKDRIALSTDGMADYFFGDKDSLKQAEQMENPIDYAGISTKGIIGVYSIEKIQKFAPSFNSSSGVATITPEQLESALVMRFRPRYEDKDGFAFED